jgi:hypothetical protein
LAKGQVVRNWAFFVDLIVSIFGRKLLGVVGVASYVQTLIFIFEAPKPLE